MPQSLTQLPKDADFRVLGWEIQTRNHRIINCAHGLWGVIIDIIRDSDSSMDTLYQFEKQGISWEMAVECFAHELEYHDTALSDTICWCYDNLEIKKMFTEKTLERIDGFSESAAGRKIAEQFIEKIRNCDDWEELYDEMQMTGKFRKDMKRRIKRELKKQLASESK